MESIFDQEDTMCDRIGNSCKLRYKCKRYTENSEDRWIANYWREFGRLCPHQIPHEKEEVIVKGLSEAQEKKGQ